MGRLDVDSQPRRFGSHPHQSLASASVPNPEGTSDTGHAVCSKERKSFPALGKMGLNKRRIEEPFSSRPSLIHRLLSRPAAPNDCRNHHHGHRPDRNFGPLFHRTPSLRPTPQPSSAHAPSIPSVRIRGNRSTGQRLETKLLGESVVSSMMEEGGNVSFYTAETRARAVL
jgi:hypothetical protein